ncbi:RluA family pseudouridine synthase [Adhaeretor mobilis]|uniref:Pseudouridine synthase n=1 Tax=Adhaeretor mobilis TaxID=1930276 RepID=A0A517MVR0_9BACT|nr:RluA family pseudouridine synthase [Adhaeretor mobilis]QDS98959.1 Pseudouridine synthase [Adhaeretor mobilis]
MTAASRSDDGEYSSGQPAGEGHSIKVPTECAGQRLDAFLASELSHLSRVQIRRGIDAGECLVDGRVRKPSFKLSGEESLDLQLSAPAPTGPEPEPIDLDILYEDDHLAVVNKPAGMVVHPAKGHWAGTLASALAFRFQNLSSVGGETRPGIVHRLDRDTSGVIVVAKTDVAHRHLAKQFQDRTVKKEYLAIVSGRPDRDRDQVDFPIGPHPSKREKMALNADHPDSRQAQTFYEVLERYPGFSTVRAEPKTGRTHQIRLHMLHAGHAILCDKLYGGRSQLTMGDLRSIVRVKHLQDKTADEVVLLDRQALHAHRITITHPDSGEIQTFEAPIAPDIAAMQSLLREIAKAR